MAKASKSKARKAEKNGRTSAVAPPTPFKVRVRPIFPLSQKGIFANHMIAQADEHEIHLSFFDVKPPIITEESQPPKDGLELDSECVTRVVISKERGKAFLLALASILEVPVRPIENTDGK